MNCFARGSNWWVISLCLYPKPWEFFCIYFCYIFCPVLLRRTGMEQWDLALHGMCDPCPFPLGSSVDQTELLREIKVQSPNHPLAGTLFVCSSWVLAIRRRKIVHSKLSAQKRSVQGLRLRRNRNGQNNLGAKCNIHWNRDVPAGGQAVLWPWAQCLSHL